MGAGAKAYLLAGDCLTIPTRFCMPFKEFCIHTLGSSPPIGSYPDSGLFGCGAYSATPGTQFLPEPRIPDALTSHPLYGRTSATLTMPTFFQTADLATWRERKVIGPMDPYNIRASGPAVQQAHMVTEVRRRLKRTATPNNNSYANRYEFNFTDATTPLSNQPDPIGFLHPAMYFWTNKNVPEPFLAVDYFEDSGVSPPTSDNYNQNIIPFCNPLNAYSESGALLGQYIGYTAMYYFGIAYIKYPIPGFRPEDYYSPLPVKPEALPTYQFFTLDCHIFMAASPASGQVLKSPKINSTRNWVYNRDGTTWNVCDQYMYMLCGALTNNWKFNVKFNHIDGTDETILFNFSNFQVFVTP